MGYDGTTVVIYFMAELRLGKYTHGCPYVFLRRLAFP